MNILKFLWCLLLPFWCVSGFCGNNYILALMLYVINSTNNDTIFYAPIGCGANLGNKQRAGDHKTPEGNFRIEDASKWLHDFHDGAGLRKEAYGRWFFRIRMPKWNSIGIHGTCFPESIGTRCSEGCVRMRNEDLEILKKYVKINMVCIIEPD